MKREFIKTADGSTSIYLEEMDEHYHSKHGAIAESNHIFIQNGLLYSAERMPIAVFEVGMGTGLNVMTTLKAAQLHNLEIDYHTVEAFPIKEDELVEINFAEQLSMNENEFRKIHSLPWDVCTDVTESFQLTKYHAKLDVIELPKNYFDVIYFDAFAPEKQEEMWSDAIFTKMFESLKSGGILVTYCVKGVIRRRLQSVGFLVEKLKGPEGGKREMCRAIKDK